MVPAFLANNPQLKRRYLQDKRRLGRNCSGCAVAALERKYRKTVIAASVPRVKSGKRRA